MMKNTVFSKPEKTEFADASYYYILIVAGITFLYISFNSYTQVLYEHCLVIPCMLFLGAWLERRDSLPHIRRFLLPAAMVAWFLLLQIKRSNERANLDNIGLFLSVYLFAFPLASVLKDGDQKKALKIFAGSYLAAAAVMSVNGLLLVLDCLPGFFSEYVCWDGDRLSVFWHPNISACYLMIGIVLCTTFLEHAKSICSKTGLTILLVLMICALALTSCRTAIILTGGYLGASLFFMMIRHGKRWFFPGVLVVLVLIVVFYKGSMGLYQMNHDMLIKKYTQQYSEQVEPDAAQDSAPESEKISEEVYKEETDISQEQQAPIKVDPDTGAVSLTTNSPQGSIVKDFGTLNSRTRIWGAAWKALCENPSLLCWGVQNPGWCVSDYSSFPIAHMHNAWLECLLGMGMVGFLIAVLVTLITLWNCLVILLKHHRDIWKRNVALLTLCLMAASVLEPYLFYTSVSYKMIDFLFFLCAGYLIHWQEKDNRYILDRVCHRLPFAKI